MRCLFFLFALIMTTPSVFAATTNDVSVMHICEASLLKKVRALTAKMPRSALQPKYWRWYLRAIQAPVKRQVGLLNEFPEKERSGIISLARWSEDFHQFFREFEPEDRRNKDGTLSDKVLPASLRAKFPTLADQGYLLQLVYQAGLYSSFIDLPEPQNSGDILDLLNHLSKIPEAEKSSVEEIRRALLPSKEEITERIATVKLELLHHRAHYQPLRQLLRDYKITFPFSPELIRQFWTQEDFPRSAFLRRLAQLVSSTPQPLKQDVKNLQAQIFMDGSEELVVEIRNRQNADGSSYHHVFSTWMSDLSTPTALEVISHEIKNPSAKLIDIGSGLGTPLFLLSAQFPFMEFLGLEVISEKVKLANERKKQLGFHRVSFTEQDLGSPDFKTPAADYYYFYAPVHKEVLEKVINDIFVSTESQAEVGFFFRSMEVPYYLVGRAGCVTKRLEYSMKYVICKRQP